MTTITSTANIFDLLEVDNKQEGQTTTHGDIKVTKISQISPDEVKARNKAFKGFKVNEPVFPTPVPPKSKTTERKKSGEKAEEPKTEEGNTDNVSDFEKTEEGKTAEPKTSKNKTKKVYIPIQPTPRTVAFNELKNKDEIAKTLECTSACRNVTTKDDKGNYGVCTRDVCTFSHSLEEHQLRMCKFDEHCRFVNTCRFRHSSETPEEFYKRTNSSPPDLPKTSEKSRKPNGKSKEEKPKEKTKEKTKEKPKEKPKDTRWDQKPIVQNQPPHPSPWGQQTMNSLYPLRMPPSRMPPSRMPLSRMPPLGVSPFGDQSVLLGTNTSFPQPMGPQIIHVPNTEMAKFATMEALKSGRNVRIVIDSM